MRKLVSIQRIVRVSPIENADAIELADILGWHVVVKKGEFKPGDLCVYCEIDTVLPKDNHWFAFLEGKRIRTMKMRGQISQGIAFPLCVLEGYDKPFNEGDDVTAFVRAEKYEPPQETVKVRKPKKWYMKYAIGRWFWETFLYKPSTINFPDWIEKTDETRVQVLQDVLAKHKGTACRVTEKLDGSSITFWYDGKKLHVCSRNKEILDTDHEMYRTADKLYKTRLKDIIFQGEFIGPKVQGNKYKLKDYDIYIFNVVEHGIHLAPVEASLRCVAAGLKTVPQIGIWFLDDNIDEIVKLSIGESEIAKGVKREGIVIRPLNNIYCNDNRFVGHRISFKAINPEFLLKYKE